MINHDELKEESFFNLFGNEFDGLVVDVGCNEGIIGQKIKCDQYIGIDNDVDAVLKATKKGLNVVVFNLNSSNSLPKGDTYLCLDIIEHLQDPKSFIKSLSSKKRVIVSVPNDYTLSNFLRMFLLNKPIVFKSGLFARGGHLHHPTIKDWKKLFSDYFEIKKIYYVPSKFSVPLFWQLRKIFTFISPRLFAHTIFFDLKTKEAKQ